MASSKSDTLIPQHCSNKLMPFLWNDLSLTSKYASISSITSALIYRNSIKKKLQLFICGEKRAGPVKPWILSLNFDFICVHNGYVPIYMSRVFCFEKLHLANNYRCTYAIILHICTVRIDISNKRNKQYKSINKMWEASCTTKCKTPSVLSLPYYCILCLALHKKLPSVCLRHHRQFVYILPTCAGFPYTAQSDVLPKMFIL